MVDGSLDCLSVDRGSIRYRTEVCDQGFRTRLCTGHQRRSPERRCEHQRNEPATSVHINGHNSPIRRKKMLYDGVADSIKLRRPQYIDLATHRTPPILNIQIAAERKHRGQTDVQLDSTPFRP